LGLRKFGYAFEARKALQSMRSGSSGGKMPRFRIFWAARRDLTAVLSPTATQKKMHHAETFHLLICGTLGPVA
jgi:hypothetical protein